MKRFLMLVMVCGGMLLSSPDADAAVFGVGCWNFNGNGHNGPLCITNYNLATGEINGHVYGNQLITGFFNEVSRQITFVRWVNNTADRRFTQVFKGYWFPDVGANPNGLKRMAGTFSAFQFSGGSANAPEYGWTATRP